jgi:hypothetical protein
VGALDDVFTAPAGTVAQGATVGFLNQGPIHGHTVTDDTGMGWFDSKVIPVNSSWQWTYPAAGNYKLECTLHSGMDLTVKVPIQVTPASGHTNTTFKVTWAAAPPPSGFVYDVQIQRPGGDWEFWQKAVTTMTASFMPDSGRGTYSFKARMKRLSNNATSWYSAAVPVTVT